MVLRLHGAADTHSPPTLRSGPTRYGFKRVQTRVASFARPALNIEHQLLYRIAVRT